MIMDIFIIGIGTGGGIYALDGDSFDCTDNYSDLLCNTRRQTLEAVPDRYYKFSERNE